MIKPRKSLENLTPYEVPLFAEEWDVKIDSNENLYGPSERVLEAIRNVTQDDIQYYPYYGELTQKIADFVGVKAQNIKITNGADEAISGVLQTYMDENDVILTSNPTFAMPLIYTKILGGKIVQVPYKEKWVFPVEEFVDAIKSQNVKIIYISTPNNPTGDCVSEDAIKAVLEVSQDKVVIIDETYGNYCGSNYSKFIEDYDNIFVVKSFSKDFALAGLRLGYIVSNEQNIKLVRGVISPYSVNNIAVIAGIAALSDYGYFKQIKENINLAKDKLTSLFKSIGAIVYPSGGNFLLCDFGEKTDFIYKKFINNKICVKNFSNVEGLKGCLRVAVPRLEEVEKLKNVLKIKPTLVFDMDGVLLNATQSYRVAIQKTFEHFSGKKLDISEIQEVKNQGGYNNDWYLTEYLLKKHGYIVSREDVISKFQEFYWDKGNGLINNEDFLMDKSLLEELSRSFNLAIFTGRVKQEAIYTLKKNGVLDYFYPIITMQDLPEDRQKPDTLGLEMIKNSIITDKIYYFGDTVDDVKCAKNADVVSVGVLPPQDKSEELIEALKNNGANVVLNSINDVKVILENDYALF